MHYIYRSDENENVGEIVWADGVLFVSPVEEVALKAVQGDEVTIAIPFETVYADLTYPNGALASFVAAFPQSYWGTFGEEFVPIPEEDGEF